MTHSKSGNTVVLWATFAMATLALLFSAFAISRKTEPVNDYWNVAKLRIDLDTLRLTISSMYELGLIAQSRSTAKIDLSSRNYSCIDIDQGKFLISCQDAEPYLDGFRLPLKIGNLMAVDFTGYDLIVRWGKRYEGNKDDIVAFAKWRKSLAEKRYSQQMYSKRLPGISVQLSFLPQSLTNLGMSKFKLK